MTLLPGEELLSRLKSDEGELLVTSHRVRFEGNDGSLTSMLLEEVCAVKLRREPIGWLRALGLLLFVGAVGLGLYAHSLYERGTGAAVLELASELATWAAVLGLLGLGAAVAYLVLRSTVLQVISVGATVTLRRRRAAGLLEALETLERAKDARYWAARAAPPTAS